MSYGTLLLKLPDGRAREYLIEKPEISIGREPDNDLVIDDPSVSHHHVRVSVEADRASITDAHSNDGTFIGSNRVSAITPSRLFEDQVMRLGRVEVRFIPPSLEVVSIDALESRPSVSTLVPALTLDGPAIHLTLVGLDRPVEPGDLVTAELIIQNRGTVGDELLIQFSGLPAGWIRLSRDRVRLLPNEHSKITVMFQPPRGSESTAAEYPFTLTVVSREHRAKATTAGVLKVGPQAGFAMHLQPVRSRKKFRLQVENHGNVPAAYRLSGLQPAEYALSYRFDRDTIDLPPGARASIGLRVIRKAKSSDRSRDLLSFNIVATPAAANQTELVTSGLLILHRSKVWRWLLALLLLIGLSAGMVWAYGRYCPQLAFCPSAAKPSIHSFIATPLELQRGGSVVIAWDVDNADQVQLVQPDAETLAKTGVATFTINRTTDFTLRATNAGGVIERTISVDVKNSSP